MDKLVATATVKSGRNADMNSPFAPFTDEQRARLMDYMKVFYDGFVEKAATARHTTAGRIDAVAQGRVWTGKQARAWPRRRAGGLDAAVDLAKQRAGIPADEDVELVVYPPRRSLLRRSASSSSHRVSTSGVCSRGERNDRRSRRLRHLSGCFDAASRWR